MKIFIICPVRKLSKGDEDKIKKYISDLEQSGIAVHFPPRDTDQNDLCGIRICSDNLKALKGADEVHIFWTSKSKGSLFDLGMAFALGKPIKLINKIKPTPSKSFENVLLSLGGLLEDYLNCKACELLYELFKLGLSNRGYWLLTELFVELHDGFDYCNKCD